MTKKKYTAAEWAAMEGGHTVEEKKSKLQLVNTLGESRIFRTKNIVNEVNVDDAANLTFMYMMALNIFNKDYDFGPFAKEYADRTVTFNNFNSFRSSGTDLYAALNRLVGKDQTYDNEKDMLAHERIKLNQLDAKRFLHHIAKGNLDPKFEQTMLLRFQKQLNIQDSMLKSLRRLSGDWDNLNQNQRALVITRMMQYLRQKAPRGEMTRPMQAFQKRGNFVVDTKDDKKAGKWKGAISVAAGAAAAVVLPKIGKELGKTSYSKGGTYQRNRFPK